MVISLELRGRGDLHRQPKVLDRQRLKVNKQEASETSNDVRLHAIGTVSCVSPDAKA